MTGHNHQLPATPAEVLRHLLRPGFDAVVLRAEMIAEEMIRAAVNGALEDAAKTAECWRCETHDDSPQHIRERTDRQDKVAREIASAIRAKKITA